MTPNPLRIVSLLPSATEIICGIGLRENLVGVTHECDHPPEVGSLPKLTASKISHETMSSFEIDHAVRRQLDGHGSIYDLNEKLLSRLKPDLIITQELCEVCAVSYSIVKEAAKLCSSEARILSLEPNTIEEIFSTIRAVGDLCGKRDESEFLVADLEFRISKLKGETSSIANEKRKRVLMLEWIDPPFAPGHWVPQQVELAGGRSVMGKAGEKSVATTYQAVIESNPEVLAVIPCGYEIPDILRQIENMVFPEELKETSAFQTGEIWALNATAYFSRPAQRVVDGAEILSKVLYSELFGLPDRKDAVRIEGESLKFD